MIYISGPMTGMPDHNYPEFNRVAAELRAKGYQVINPAENIIEEYPVGYVPRDEEDRRKTWAAYLRKDIQTLAQNCNTIALLEGWRRSEGARLEVINAYLLGMKIVDAYTLEPVELTVGIKIEVTDSVPTA